MKKNTFSKLLATSAILSSAMFSASAFALGTEASSKISNTATVSFKNNGTDKSVVSDPAIFYVDEIINVNVTAANSNSNVTNGDQNVALSYTVTNTGNGSEAFALSQSINTANNSLSLDLNDLTIYYTATPNPGVFDATDVNTKIYNDDIVIGSDEEITVYIVTNVPNTAVVDDKSELVLTAISQTEGANSAALGDVLAGKGDTNADNVAISAVVAVNQGRDSDNAELKVTDYDPTQILEVSIDKSILGVSALVNNVAIEKNIPGAMVTYFIKVTVKNATATELSISDIIPTDMTYVPGSLRKQSSPVDGIINKPAYQTPGVAANTPAIYSNFDPVTDINTDNDGAATTPNTGAVKSIKVDFNDAVPGEYAILLDATIN